jgi:hypothetical protein
MATTTASNADDLIAALPPERQKAVAAVRDVVRANLQPGFEEQIGYGGFGWVVPLERFPDTYNKQPLALAGLISQKNYISLYLNNVYGDPATERWFQEQYAASGKKLNMGKSCLRFRNLEDLPLDVIGATIARTSVDDYVRRYESVRGSLRKARYGSADQDV